MGAGASRAIHAALRDAASDDIDTLLLSLSADHRQRIFDGLEALSGQDGRSIACSDHIVYVTDLAGNSRGTFHMRPGDLVSDVAKQLQLSAGMQVQLVYDGGSLDLGLSLKDAGISSGTTLTLVVVGRIERLDDIAGKFSYNSDMHLPVVVGNIAKNEYTTLWIEPDYDAAFAGLQAKDGECIEVLEVKSKPGAFARIRCQEGEGWISMDNLHVQIVIVGKGSIMPAGSFLLKPDIQVVHGQTRSTGGSTVLRHRPNNEQGSNFNGQKLLDGEIVIVRDLVGRDGCPGGCHWALVEKFSAEGVGWIMSRNLHVQLVWAS